MPMYPLRSISLLAHVSFPQYYCSPSSLQVLPSIVNEVLKSEVARHDANQLLAHREQVNFTQCFAASKGTVASLTASLKALLSTRV